MFGSLDLKIEHKFPIAWTRCRFASALSVLSNCDCFKNRSTLQVQLFVPPPLPDRTFAPPPSPRGANFPYTPILGREYAHFGFLGWGCRMLRTQWQMNLGGRLLRGWCCWETYRSEREKATKEQTSPRGQFRIPALVTACDILSKTWHFGWKGCVWQNVL